MRIVVPATNHPGEKTVRVIHLQDWNIVVRCDENQQIQSIEAKKNQTEKQ